MKQKSIHLFAFIAVFALLGLDQGWADTNNPCVAPSCTNACEMLDTNGCACVSCYGGKICCGGGCIDSTTYGCCNDTPYNLSSQDCCGSNVYNTATQGCCDGKVYDLATQECCGTNVYDTATQGCCEGKVYDLATQRCCEDAGAYDPDTQGCCTKSDGSHEITSNPENANPDQVAIDKGWCDPLTFGGTFCYNGQLTTAICPRGRGLDTNLQTCVQAHEDVHKTDPNFSCSDCSTRGPTVTSSNWMASECAAWTAAQNCLNGKDHSTPGWPALSAVVSNAILGYCP